MKYNSLDDIKNIVMTEERICTPEETIRNDII